jgi:hypothetical protein
MKTNRNLFAAAVIVISCIVIVWLSVSIKGSPKKYEIQPHITVPEYKTDAARAIDAYERLMDRYMDLTERSIFRVDTDIRDVAEKLDSIDDKLTRLSTRIAGIEKALGIKQVETDINTDIKDKPQAEPTDKKSSYSSED